MTQVQFNNKLFGLKNELFYYALSLTTNREKAQDLTQETFLKALSYRKKYRHNKNFKGWVFTIMRNTFINSYRRESKGKNINLTTGDNFYVEISDKKTFPSPETFINTKDIYKCIGSLTDAYRVPFNMFVEGYKYNEIADELELPMGTVKSRIYFARKKLQLILMD